VCSGALEATYPTLHQKPHDLDNTAIAIRNHWRVMRARNLRVVVRSLAGDMNVQKKELVSSTQLNALLNRHQCTQAVFVDWNALFDETMKGDSNKYLVRAAVNAATMQGVKTVSPQTAAKVAEFLYRSNSIWSALSVYSTMTSSILEEPWLRKFLVNLLLYVPRGSEKAIELLSVAVENKFHVSLGTLVDMHYIWSEMLKKQCGAKEMGLPIQMSSSLSSSASSLLKEKEEGEEGGRIDLSMVVHQTDPLILQGYINTLLDFLARRCYSSIHPQIYFPSCGVLDLTSMWKSQRQSFALGCINHVLILQLDKFKRSLDTFDQKDGTSMKQMSASLLILVANCRTDDRDFFFEYLQDYLWKN